MTGRRNDSGAKCEDEMEGIERKGGRDEVMVVNAASVIGKHR